MTKPNSASRHSPRAITIAISTAITALNRVKALARMISPTVRDGRSSVRLTRPAAMRSSTSALVSPAPVVAAVASLTS